LDTFPDCETHLRWVTIGGRRWIEEVGPTYGPTGKTITGVMPSFEATLTPEQVAQVTAFERVQFGGGTSEQVLADCGLG
jgi:mono/diheme cytochrome c family protein